MEFNVPIDVGCPTIWTGSARYLRWTPISCNHVGGEFNADLLPLSSIEIQTQAIST